MATLSLCMIVKDEAENLPRALASVRDLADEIVIIDTGSGDSTPTIAEKAGAKVNFLMWGDDFAVARNASLDQATKDWILVLDADETLTQKGYDFIRSVKEERPMGQVKPEDLLLVTMMRQEIGANQSPYTQVSRLFRNLVEIKYTRPYHEGVEDSVQALMAKEDHWQVAQLGAVGIGHTGYGVGAIAARDKFKRAQRIMEKHLAEHPDDAYMANKLGALYTQSNAPDDGQYEKALELLARALRSQNFDPMTEYELHYHRGIAYRRIEGNLAESEAAYRQAIEVPIAGLLKLGAYLNLGALLKMKGDLDGAMAQYEAAGRIDPTQPVTFLNLGLVHRARGYLDPAMRAYEYAISLDPNYGAAYQNLGVVLFKLGKLPHSKAAFEKAISLVENTDPAEAERLRQGLKSLKIDQALGL
ncbi:MAG: glycosyltransferase [Cyanobacteria bacterium P01_C01_bin.121]